MLKRHHVLLGLMLTLALVVSLAPLAGAQAQDDGGNLSEDELALLARGFAASENLESLDTLRYETIENEESDVTFFQDGEIVQADAGFSETTTVVEVTLSEPRSFVANRVVTERDSEGELLSEAAAEMIYVDDMLYISAESSAGAFSFPEGFVLLSEDSALDDLSVFAPFDLAADILNEENDEDDLLAQQEVLEAVAFAVAIDQREFNGQTVDVISFRIDSVGFLALLDATEDGDQDPTSRALFERAEVDGLFEVGIYPESEITAFTNFSLAIFADNLDMSELDDQFPEGFNTTFILNSQQVENYVDLNPELAPIVAPEVSE